MTDSPSPLRAALAELVALQEPNHQPLKVYVARCEAAWEAARAALAAPALPAEPPTGWKLVPIEYTTEQMDAALKRAQEFTQSKNSNAVKARAFDFCTGYRVMVAAAPTLSVPSSEPTRSQKLREAGFTRRPSPPGKMAGNLWRDPEEASAAPSEPTALRDAPLPPLPQAIGWLGLMSPEGPREEVYTATQMREYARAALAAPVGPETDAPAWRALVADALGDVTIARATLQDSVETHGTQGGWLDEERERLSRAEDGLTAALASPLGLGTDSPPNADGHPAGWGSPGPGYDGGPGGGKG